MKQLGILASVIFVLVVGLVVGCAPAPAPEVPAEEVTPEEVTPEEEVLPEEVVEPVLRFDFVGAGTAGDPAWAIVKRGVDHAAALLGVNAIMHFGTGATADTIARIAEVMAAETDGIGIWLYDPAMGEGVQKARDAGIPVIQLGTKDPEWAARGVLSVSYGDLYYTGLFLGTWLAQYIEDGAHILISAEVPGLAYSEGRKKGFLDALDKAGITYTYYYLDAGYELGIVEERITAYMVANPELDVAIGVGGMTTERTAVAAETLGYEPGQILIAGWDPLPETVAGIKKGYVKGIALDPRYLEGFYGVVQLYFMAHGLPPADIVLSELIVDSTNVSILETPYLKM